MIPDRSEALARLHRDHIEDRPQASPERRQDAPLRPAENGSGPSDPEVVERLLAESTDKGRRLHAGDTSGYNSDSEADLAYLDKLAFYTQDPDQLDRIWRASGLSRKKLDRTNYRRGTIDQALTRHVGDYYDWTRRVVSLSRRTGAERIAGADEAPANLFRRADLTTSLREGVKPPEVLVPEVLLAGKVHSIFSAGGTGKTFMMLHLVKRVVERGERVAIFDLENGLRIMAERLELLGVTPEQSGLIHYYPFPSMPMDEGVIRAFEVLLEEVDPALVVFDSWVNCLAACGLDENKSTDIAAWADAYSQKARQRGTAVLILDHVPKEGGSARGSGRKLDYVDVQFELRNPQPFDRGTVGRVDLHLRKDREGWLPRHLTYAVGGEPEEFVFKRSVGIFTECDEAGLTPMEQKTLEALRSFKGLGAFDAQWKEVTLARGVSKSKYYGAKKALLERALVEEVMRKFFPAKVQSEDDFVEV